MHNTVEVLAVQRLTDAVSGKPMFQIFFGKTNEVDKEIRERLPDEQQNSTEVYSNVVSVWVPLDKGSKYPVGSTWNVDIADQGEIKISKAKE